MTDLPAPAEPVPALLARGFEALLDNRIDEASHCCRQVLAREPQRIEGHFLVGLIASHTGDNRTAVSAFGSVTKLKPSHAAAWAQLARLLFRTGQANRADAALAEAVRHCTGDAVVQDLIGTVHSLLGEEEIAGSWFARAVAQQPDNVGFLINHANSLVFTGQRDAAIAELERALALQPGNAQAHWLLAGTRRATDRSHVETLERLAARVGDNDRAAAFVHYALGKELEDLEDWPAAFRAFARGAAARRRTIDYDEEAEAELFAALEEVYTAEWLAAAPPGHPDASPIFILGQPRTGTTLIERIVSSHSAVHSAGELQQFGLSIRRLTRHPDPRRFSAELMRAAAALDGHALGEAYLAASRKLRGDAPRFTDKLPLNFLYLPLILAALPNAKIVHVVRDPMDACFASFKQLFADAYPHSYELGEMARHHARYRRLMAVWRERFPGRFFDIGYESTVGDLESSARALIAYLELPWEDACLDFHRQRAAVTTASAVQVREPVHARSVRRWRRYARELEPLRVELQRRGVDA